MNYSEVEARLEVVTNCILGDILADFNEPEVGDFDYENATVESLSKHLSDMVEAHVLDSDEMLEFHEVVVQEEPENVCQFGDDIDCTQTATHSGIITDNGKRVAEQFGIACDDHTYKLLGSVSCKHDSPHIDQIKMSSSHSALGQ